jgi:hypothetical protein
MVVLAASLHRCHLQALMLHFQTTLLFTAILMVLFTATVALL